MPIINSSSAAENSFSVAASTERPLAVSPIAVSLAEVKNSQEQFHCHGDANTEIDASDQFDFKFTDRAEMPDEFAFTFADQEEVDSLDEGNNTDFNFLEKIDDTEKTDISAPRTGIHKVVYDFNNGKPHLVSMLRYKENSEDIELILDDHANIRSKNSKNINDASIESLEVNFSGSVISSEIKNNLFDVRGPKNDKYLEKINLGILLNINEINIYNAFPQAGGTNNRAHTPIMKRMVMNNEVEKYKAHAFKNDIYQKLRRDKAFKSAAEESETFKSVKRDSNTNIINALHKHMIKHNLASPGLLSEVLYLPKSSYFDCIDAFILDFSSYEFQPLSSTEIQKYLTYNSEMISPLSHQIGDKSLLILYFDQKTGLRQFGFVEFDLNHNAHFRSAE